MNDADHSTHPVEPLQPLQPLEPAQVAGFAARVLDEVARAVVGKREVLSLVLAGILAKGHVLLEDFPGLGKTLAARSFAGALGLDFSRAQFTPDLLPADRVDEASSDLRVLSSHVQSDQPSDAVAHRLVALARARDRDLAETVRRELADTRRLSPADIDRILTRIEDVP